MRGFNLIATANDRDRGVNELSTALRRRFNTVVLPLPATAEEEIAIVAQRVAELGAALAAAARSRRRPTRSAGSSRSSASCATASPRTAAPASRSPTGTLSTAEAISVVTNGLALAAHFGDGTLRADRRRRRHRRRRRARSAARRRRLARVPRGGGARPRRVGRVLRRLPRPRLRRAVPVAAAPARHPPPRAGLGPRRCARALDALQPDVVLVEVPADAAGGAGVDRPRRAGARRSPCSATSSTEPAAGRVRPARRVQPGVAGGRCGRARARRPGASRSTCRCA